MTPNEIGLAAAAALACLIAAWALLSLYRAGKLITALEVQEGALRTELAGRTVAALTLQPTDFAVGRVTIPSFDQHVADATAILERVDSVFPLSGAREHAERTATAGRPRLHVVR